MQTVENDYVAPVDGQELTKDALAGMLGGLDPHSRYMDAREFREFLGEFRGSYVGLGLEIAEDGAFPKVVTLMDGTPAARAGLRVGDLITRIDGQATHGLALAKIMKMLRGRPGVSITVTVGREHVPPFDAVLTRAVLTIPTVTFAMQPRSVGYARITEFSENTPQELATAITTLKRDAGAPLKGFVLDLRSDPGGVLDAAVGVAGKFLDGGTVVSIRGRSRDDNQVFAAPVHGDMLPGTPLVVLIDGATASAAEIVAGALQDRSRAIVIGTVSFGKGSVQTILPVEGGGAISLTTALYFTPSGRSIQDRGITPDIDVGVPPDQQDADTIIEREADLPGAFVNPDATRAVPHPVDQPGDDRLIKPSLIGTAGDAQLTAALRELHRVTADRM